MTDQSLKTVCCCQLRFLLAKIVFLLEKLYRFDCWYSMFIMVFHFSDEMLKYRQDFIFKNCIVKFCMQKFIVYLIILTFIFLRVRARNILVLFFVVLHWSATNNIKIYLKFFFFYIMEAIIPRMNLLVSVVYYFFLAQETCF